MHSLKIIPAAILSSLMLVTCSNEESPSPQVTAGAQVSTSALSGVENFTAISAGNPVGQLVAQHDDVTRIQYEVRNNGRGPTIEEIVAFTVSGMPQRWTVTGNTTFGNSLNESFELTADGAIWQDTTGSSDISLSEPRLYIAQEASPYALWVYTRLLLEDDDNMLEVLPAGQISLAAIESFDVSAGGETRSITTYALSGINLNPGYLALDEDLRLFAVMSPGFALIRTGFESEEQRMRDLAAEYAARRFETIQATVARRYEGPVQVRNVRIFDPASLTLTPLSTVVYEGNRIRQVLPAEIAADSSAIVIEGGGGTLVAGMYEMHGHLDQDSALLNIAAGVTSVRDMGNENEVLSTLIEHIDSGRLAGPRVTRSGFIEGSSPYNANSGIIVSSESEALEAVQAYADGDFYQVKIYNSMNPDWVPAVVSTAHALGLRVAGHVPAFSNADTMIAAGYDELTHINQVMLGWVLEPDEDTRTLLRLTALRRLPALTMDNPAVQHTIATMAASNVAIDPTLAIHEALTLSRNGELSPGLVDYIDHMPVSEQRDGMTAWADIATAEDDRDYTAAFEKIIETVAEMRRQGVFIVPGTDLGGSFTYHRELELYQRVGMSSAEILKMATWDMADYLGQSDELGSIEAGKLADFFLVPGDPVEDLKAIKTISMVVMDGVLYFPSEIYPSFGIRPFVDAPPMTVPDQDP